MKTKEEILMVFKQGPVKTKEEILSLMNYTEPCESCGMPPSCVDAMRHEIDMWRERFLKEKLPELSEEASKWVQHYFRHIPSDAFLKRSPEEEFKDTVDFWIKEHLKKQNYS